MKIEDYVTALTLIDGALWQVIGGLKAEALKKRMNTLPRMRTRIAAQ